MTGQSRHHAQQQLRKMLCLDFYVGLLDGYVNIYISDVIILHLRVRMIHFILYDSVIHLTTCFFGNFLHSLLHL